MQGSFNDTWHLLDGKRQVMRIGTSKGTYDVSVGGSGRIGEPVQILTAKEREEFINRLRNFYSLSDGTYMAIEEHGDEKRPDRINVALNGHTELTGR